ncbi:MAG: hydroxymethylbilane synthase [Flavobacteriaceae bacterium]|nr:hydroxymethylbilane synthase [Flavobacteriaceae bacterium]|tara:strand:- start:36430 stop:38013 length:1584 start_codon:yes stop_codon:yes gene_type:complete
MDRVIKIGTRRSELAMWQAEKVQAEMEALGVQTEIVPIDSQGDIELTKPLYELGITGIFTKNLDIALLNKTIDVAVHSLKDVPTKLPIGIVQAAVLPRGSHRDVLLVKNNEEFLSQPQGTIATGSLRRKAMWLNKYPTHKVVNLRGNVNTRLEKLENNDWDGAIFAGAGLERLGKKPKSAVNLSWMVPAPAQGAVMVACLDDDDEVKELCREFNDADTELCTSIEREFLQLLEGGCTAPIGAFARIDEVNKELHFKGVLLKKDGSKKIETFKSVPIEKNKYVASDCANYIFSKGGKQLMLEDEGVEKANAIYSTKKLSESQKAKLHSSIKVSESDFIKIRFNRINQKIVENTLDHVVITSQNGVEALAYNFTKDQLDFTNIYCVGRRTKKLIERKIGPVAHVAKNAKQLGEYLSQQSDIENITYFCGNLRIGDLEAALAETKIQLNEVIAYNTFLSPEKLEPDTKAVLFFSPSGIESYLQENTPNQVAFCIGETTAKVAREHFEEVKVANMPSVESVIEQVNLHFES